MNTYEKEVSKPHSNYVTGVLGQKAEALVFLEKVLPEDDFAMIDPDTFRVEPTVYIDGLLKDHQSDLLFSYIPPGYKKKIFLYLLFEHKSSSYRAEFFDQSLRYQAKIYEILKPRGIVFPIIFYHGVPAWGKRDDFQKTFDMPANIAKRAKDWAMNFRPLLINAKDLKPEQMEIVWFSTFVKALNRINRIKESIEELRLFVREEKEFWLAENPSGVYTHTISYLSTAGGYERDDIIAIIKEEVSVKAGEKAMKTIGDEKVEAYAEGRAEGREAERLQIARNLADDGISMEKVQGLTGLSVDVILNAGLTFQ